MYYLLGILACAPLIASTVAKSWDWGWGDMPRSILPVSVDRGLIVIQALLCLAFAFAATPAVLYAITALYAVMGAAVVWLRLRLGRADCGCWGRSRSGRMSFGLAAADFAFAALAAGAASAAPAVPPLAPRLFAFGTMVILAFFIMVTLPAYRPLLKRYRELADRYRPWVAGFPHLQATSQAADR